MRTQRHSLALFLLLPLAACGGGSGDDTGDDDVQQIDARPAIDSGPAPDAAPDAAPGAFDCIGDPFPTTAPDPIAVGGLTNEINTNGQVALTNVVVTAYDASDAQLDQATSDGSAAYALSLATGGVPLDGYLTGTHANYKDTYVYPPQPLPNDQSNVPVLMVSNTVWAFLPILADATQDAQHGFVGVLVVDCFGSPVPGASVTVTGAATVRYVSGTGVSQTATATDSSGIALAFNVPPGASVSVDASTAGNEFFAHSIEVRADVVTTTIVAPGPIDGLAP